MAELDPLDLSTRQEKIIVVSAVFISVFVHILIFFGNYMDLWPDREEKEQQMMIIRRMPEMTDVEISTPPPLSQVKKALQRKEVATETAKKPENPEPSENLEKKPEDKYDKPRKEEDQKPEDKEKKENTISVYTDLNSAFFRIEGPMNFKGAGTFWEKKSLPAGEYKISFGTVEGYQTPEPQSSNLQENGAVSFYGRYTKTTQVTVETNLKMAHYQIMRPDGLYLSLEGNRQGIFENLPQGTYTIIFEDVTGYTTPAPQNRILEPSGQLNFSGFYTYVESAQRKPMEKKVASTSKQPLLDRRIKLVVKSYPETSIEREFLTMAYPEKIINTSNYQEGWCQVYLIVSIDGSGRIKGTSIQRPKDIEREKFAPLIEAVKKAVGQWDFEAKVAEIHVDVRFFVEK